MKTIIKSLSLIGFLCAAALQASEAQVATEADAKKAAAKSKLALWNATHQDRCTWILEGFHSLPAVNAPVSQQQIQNNLPITLTKHIEEFALGTKQKTLFISAHAKELSPALLSFKTRAYADSIFFYLEVVGGGLTRRGVTGDPLIEGSPAADTLSMPATQEIIFNPQQFNSLQQCGFSQLKHIICLYQIRRKNIETASENNKPLNFNNAVEILQTVAQVTLTPQQSVRHQAFQKAAETNPVLRTMLAHLERNYTIKLATPAEDSSAISATALESNNVSN